MHVKKVDNIVLLPKCYTVG